MNQTPKEVRVALDAARLNVEQNIRINDRRNTLMQQIDQIHRSKSQLMTELNNINYESEIKKKLMKQGRKKGGMSSLSRIYDDVVQNEHARQYAREIRKERMERDRKRERRIAAMVEQERKEQELEREKEQRRLELVREQRKQQAKGKLEQLEQIKLERHNLVSQQNEQFKEVLMKHKRNKLVVEEQPDNNKNDSNLKPSIDLMELREHQRRYQAILDGRRLISKTKSEQKTRSEQKLSEVVKNEDEQRSRSMMQEYGEKIRKNMLPKISIEKRSELLNRLKYEETQEMIRRFRLKPVSQGVIRSVLAYDDKGNPIIDMINEVRYEQMDQRKLGNGYLIELRSQPKLQKRMKTHETEVEVVRHKKINYLQQLRERRALSNYGSETDQSQTINIEPAQLLKQARQLEDKAKYYQFRDKLKGDQYIMKAIRTKLKALHTSI